MNLVQIYMFFYYVFLAYIYFIDKLYFIDKYEDSSKNSRPNTE